MIIVNFCLMHATLPLSEASSHLCSPGNWFIRRIIIVISHGALTHIHRECGEEMRKSPHVSCDLLTPWAHGLVPTTSHCSSIITDRLSSGFYEFDTEQIILDKVISDINRTNERISHGESQTLGAVRVVVLKNILPYGSWNGFESLIGHHKNLLREISHVRPWISKIRQKHCNVANATHAASCPPFLITIPYTFDTYLLHVSSAHGIGEVIGAALATTHLQVCSYELLADIITVILHQSRSPCTL